MTSERSSIIRAAVIDELSRQGWSNYKLVKELGPAGKRLQSAIYGWLAGSRNISERSASIVMDRLGLIVQRPEQDRC